MISTCNNVFYHLKALKKTEQSDSIIRQLSFVIRRFDLYKVYRFGWDIQVDGFTNYESDLLIVLFRN